MKTFEMEFDIDYLTKSNVILDHFPTHTEDRDYIIKSWRKYGWYLTFTIFMSNF